MSAKTMTEAMFLTEEKCLECGQGLVNMTRLEDDYPVLGCVARECVMPLYAVIEGHLVPFCAFHNRPTTECGCEKDGE